MTYQTSVPAAGIAYPSSTYQDELTLAALFLASAENSTQRYGEAEEYYSTFELGGYDGVFNWDSKTPGLAVLFSQLAKAGLGGNMRKWQAEAERYFDNTVDEKGPGFLTNGQYGDPAIKKHQIMGVQVDYYGIMATRKMLV